MAQALPAVARFRAPIASIANGVLRYYLLAGRLGSTSIVLDTAGSLVSSQKYHPYGRTRSTTGVNPTDKLFTGHQSEGELYFAQARFYDPWIGLFTQPDSIVPQPGNPQSLNRYAYVLNNPLGYVDPSGMEPNQGLYCLLGCGTAGSSAPSLDPDYICISSFSCNPSGDNVCLSGSCLVHAAVEVAKAVVSAAPVTGDILDICMGLTGKDCLSWQDVPDWQRGLVLASLFSPVGFSRYSDEAAEALRFADEAAAVAKRVNLPAWRKVSIDMEHIAPRHMAGGTETAGRTVFPEYMDRVAVERAIRQAYRFGHSVETQGQRVRVIGTYDKLTIEMWVNKATTSVETAYPIFP